MSEEHERGAHGDLGDGGRVVRHASHTAERSSADECQDDGIELYRLGVSDGDLRSLLTRVSRLAAETVPQTDAVSLTLGSPGEPGLLVASSTLAQTGDGMQFHASAGPSFDAFRSGWLVRADDLADDERWPSLRRLGSDSDGPRSALAMPMVSGDVVIGVVSVYSSRAGELGDDLVSRVAPFAATAERLVRDDRAVSGLQLTTGQLQEALTSRAVIDQAKGMIMLTARCGPEEAFDVLRRTSQTRNRKLRDIAMEIVSAGSVGASLTG